MSLVHFDAFSITNQERKKKILKAKAFRSKLVRTKKKKKKI